jgi:hypothetical protein
VRCPTCKREFTPLELQRAVLGERLGVPQDEPMLEEEPDEDDEDDSSDPDAPDPDDDSEESDDSEP